MEFRFRTLQESFIPLIRNVLEFGDEIVTEGGDRCIELRNVGIEITNPNILNLDRFDFIHRDAFREYRNMLIAGTENNFVYDYHSRLVNQFDYVVEKMKRGDSRRAIMVTWRPDIDCVVGLEDRGAVPCLIMVQFLVRKRNVDMTVVFRSNDLILAYPVNVYGLIGLGNELVRRAGYEKIRKYYHFVSSLHIYVDRDRDVLKRLIGEDYEVDRI